MELLLILVLCLAGVGWFVSWLLRPSAPPPSLPSVKARRVVSSTKPVDDPEAWRQKVHPVRRGDEMVVLQTTRANQKPTIAPFIEDIVVPADVLDLRSVSARRSRVVGTSHYNVPERVLVWTWLLVREPGNKFDANAVSVRFVSGERAGHLSAELAASLAELLDATGSAQFYVTGVGSEGTTSSRVWVDTPRVPVLRGFVKGLQ